ncbi:MAG: metallophosphoesterase [Clostridiales bacterium]|nr:metallophosphoesterase [Clostridiales bacterium]
MIRIGVISDTHGSLAALDACIRAAGEVDCWFHLGDYASDAKRLERTGKPVYRVLGNCDGGFVSSLTEATFPEKQKEICTEAVVNIGGARILLCHGHTMGVDLGSWSIGYRAEELCCSAALYGHTHIAELSAFGKVLKLNPGSPSRPRAGRKPSFAVMEIENGDVNAGIKILS